MSKLLAKKFYNIGPRTSTILRAVKVKKSLYVGEVEKGVFLNDFLIGENDEG
jgi:hypothetical protein